MATTVRVARGDTLSAIAKRNNVTLANLIKANPQITDPSRIVAGQTVRIPGAVTAAPTKPPVVGTRGGIAPSVPATGATGTMEVVTDPVVANNAMAIIRDTLRMYGLEEMADGLMSTLTDKKYRLPDGSISTDLVWEEITKTPVYQRRFAPKIARDNFIAAEVAAGRTPSLAPISEANQIALEQDYKQRAAARGLPLGFYDNVDDFTNLIVNDISPDEFDKRITLAYEATNMAPPEVKAALKNRYGLQDTEIMAFYLDPEKAKKRTLGQLTRDVNTAAIQATGLVGQDQADLLASEFAPGTKLLDTRAFTEQAAQLAPLSRGDITGVQSMATGEDVLRATAGQTGAKSRIKKEQERRLAEYGAGGGLAAGNAGVVGLRSTSDVM